MEGSGWGGRNQITVIICSAGRQEAGIIDGLAVALFHVLRNLKTKPILKPEPGGCAPRQRLTLLLAQKSKQKRACAALGMSGASRRQRQFREF